jgi:hypothetical protein
MAESTRARLWSALWRAAGGLNVELHDEVLAAFDELIDERVAAALERRVEEVGSGG